MPPLTTENASALCGGVPSMENDMRATQPDAKPAEVQVEVLRNFQDHRRQILKKGSKTTLPRLFAIEMQAANKVRILPEGSKEKPTPDPDPGAGDDDADKPKRGSGGKKGERDAG